MELPQLISALSEPAAYPHAAEPVRVLQTHISVVFLAGPFVYKIKKPVAPGFLDFTTLEKRQHFCREEVRLNRRLAPAVYLGVVPVLRTATGARFGAHEAGEPVEDSVRDRPHGSAPPEGPLSPSQKDRSRDLPAGQTHEAGEPIEWAVKMQRLPESATLLRRVLAGEVDQALVESVADRIAAFHRTAETNERIASFGRFAVVAQNMRDVFERAAPHIATVLNPAVFTRVRARAGSALAELRSVIDGRAARGVPRDCHGDLHLDHIYYFPDRAPPEDLIVIDCIEFNESFRFTDPVADAAFVAMDLAFRGQRALARTFTDAYVRAAGEVPSAKSEGVAEGRTLFPLYTAYRAAVRGMVDGLLCAEPEVPQADRTAAAARARAYWLLALSELEAPGARPGLVLVGGLPGTGKSVLARSLVARAGFTVIRSDVVRKVLANLPAHAQSPPDVRARLYAQEWTERTYTECLSRAECLLVDGQRVLVDATFGAERHRAAFVDLAVRCGVPVAVLICEAGPETVKRRLLARRNDASDADWDVYQRATGNWEAAGPDVRRVLRTVSTEGDSEQALDQALGVLREVGLVAGERGA
jgi:aminoglycoside phosphotransferase family enzyme/predicted kinase